MAQLFCQLVPRHAGWLLVGPPAATSLAPQQDITVTFADGTSVVVPAGTPAALPGGGTTWDRTKEVVVGYVLLGAGTLLAAPESQLSTLGTDYAPLVRVLADSVQVYQTQQVGAAAALEYVIDGGGAVLTTGAQGSLVVPFGGTITACRLLADQSGSLVLDIQKATYSGYPTGASIVGSAPPTISAAQKAQDTTLTGWTVALTAGDILAFSVSSVSTITRCLVVLSVRRSG